MSETATIPQPPFLIEHRREAGTGRDFVPSARLVLTPGFRTSGLWAALPPEETRDLLLLLTFLTPNGWIRPTLPELTEAMRASGPAARGRMERLARRQWRGGPLAVALPRATGLDAYAPGRQLLAHEEASPKAVESSRPFAAAGREAVIAYSRSRYARTREEVEAEIAQRMGWAPPDFAGEAPEVAARKRSAYEKMTGFGMAKEQALELLSGFDLDRVERQVAWLPRRAAKSPSRFLLAAIEHDYEAPPAVRARQNATGGPGPDDRPGPDPDPDVPPTNEQANR